MQISIISTLPRQSQWLCKQLKGNNIHSHIQHPNEYENKLHAEAVLIPHPLTKEDSKCLLKTPQNSPILHWPKCPSHFPESLRDKTIFLHPELNANELSIIIKEIVGKNIKKRYKQDIQFGELKLERGTRTMRFEGKQTRLTKKEFQILELLIMNAGQITTRRHIVNYVWDARSYVSPNTIEVYISRLRKKLRTLRSSIRTINSLGYELTLPTTH